MKLKVSLQSLGLVAFAGLPFLGGCLVGPNYKAPATTMPTTWADPGAQSYPTTNPARPSTQPVALAEWWRALGDDELNSLIDRAINENLDIRQATSRLRQARSARTASASGLFPLVGTSGGFSRSGGGGNQADRSNFRAGLDASWEIDIFGGVRRGLEAADAQIDVAIEDRRDVLISVISEVALNYVDLRGTQRQIEIARGNVASQRASADLTRRLFNNGNGFISRLDIVNSDALVAGTEGRIPLLEVQLRQTIYALSLLIDRNPEDLLTELSVQTPLPVAPLDVPMGMPSDLLLRRPDIRRAEAQLRSATAGVGVAEADLFPRFSLNGSFGFASNKAASLFDMSNHSWSFGPSISWPLFDAGRIRANIAIQNENQLQALLAYRATVLTALADVENALIAYVKEYEYRASVITQVESNRQAVDIAKQLYQNGNTDFLNVLSAQRSLYSSEDNLVQSDRTTITNLIALYKALGGGWESKEK